MTATVHAERREHAAMLLALTPDQRQEYLHKLQMASSYRAWANQAEKEADDILAGNVWWCSPTPETPCLRSTGDDRQGMELAGINAEWPSTEYSIYSNSRDVQMPVRVTRTSHSRTVAYKRNSNKRRRRATLKTTR